MLKRILAASAAAVFLSAAGPAAAQMMSDWLPVDVKPILAELGSTSIVEDKTAQGEPFVSATSADGLKYVVYGRECAVGPARRCAGAVLYVTYTLPTAAAARARAETRDYAAVRFHADGTTLTVSRYVILDYGITRANFKANFEVFLTIAHAVWAQLSGA